jgi:hypothetical protein
VVAELSWRVTQQTDAETALSWVQDEHAKFATQRAELESELEGRNYEADMLRSNLSTAHSDAAVREAEHSRQVAAARSEADALRSQLSTAHSDAAAREAVQSRQVAAARSEVASAREETAACEVQLAAASQQLASTRSDATSSAAHSHAAQLSVAHSMASAPHEAGAACKAEMSSQLEVSTAADEARSSSVHAPSSNEESGEYVAAGDTRLASHDVAQGCSPSGDDVSASLSEGSSEQYVSTLLRFINNDAHVITKPAPPPTAAATKPAAKASLWRCAVRKLTPGYFQ